MNKCNLVKDLLPLYVDGALSEDSRALVERHLKGCPSCAEEAEKLKAPVPEERALAALKADEQQTNDRKQAASIRRVSRKFKIRAAVVGAVSALLCCVIVFCCYFIPAEYARKERLLEFNGWREYEGIRRNTHIETNYALPDYNAYFSSLGYTQPAEHYFIDWTEQKTATPYIYGEDNTDIQIKFRHSNRLAFQQESPFTFSYGLNAEAGLSGTFQGRVTFTTSTIDVEKIVVRAKTPALYEYLQEHPELYDPLEFAYFCFNYDFESVTPWSSESKILLTNDMRLLMTEESIWGAAVEKDALSAVDNDGFPVYTDRYVKPFEHGEYRGYLLMHYTSQFAQYLQHIIFSYGGYLWDIRFEADNSTRMPLSSDSFDLTYFIDNLEFIGIG